MNSQGLVRTSLQRYLNHLFVFIGFCVIETVFVSAPLFIDTFFQFKIIMGHFLLTSYGLAAHRANQALA